MKNAPSAALIGDVVASRRSADRPRLHRRLGEVLAHINQQCEPVAPLRITVGDEYQGVFATVGTALAASLQIRVALLPEIDVRHGIGWGPVEILQDQPRVEDGPGWWAARAAIEDVKSQADKAATKEVRTGYRLADDCDRPEPLAITAALALRDHLVGTMSTRSLSLLAGMLGGRTQAAVADELGISASAASQRVRTDGVGVVLMAAKTLGEIR